MEKKSWYVLAICAIAMLTFEVCGFCNQMDVAKVAFIVAGVTAWIFLSMRGIVWLRQRNGCYMG